MHAFLLVEAYPSARMGQPLRGRGAGSKAFLGQSRATLSSTRGLLIGFSSPLDKVSHSHNLSNSSFSGLVASALWNPLGASLNNKVPSRAR